MAMNRVRFPACRCHGSLPAGSSAAAASTGTARPFANRPACAGNIHGQQQSAVARLTAGRVSAGPGQAQGKANLSALELMRHLG